MRPMDFKRVFLGAIFLFALFVWTFKQIGAADADNAAAPLHASADWTEGVDIYDIDRCGLPFKNVEEKKGGRVVVRAKRYKAHPKGAANKNGTGKGGTSTRKVMGGRSVREGDFPWAVALFRHGDYVCSGTLISRRHVLTAAHCFTMEGLELGCNETAPDQGCCEGQQAGTAMEEALAQYTVKLGSICMNQPGGGGAEEEECKGATKQQEYGVKKLQYIQFFEGKCRGNDYALLELNVDAVPASVANHICLVHLDEHLMGEDLHGLAKPVVAFGWGYDPQYVDSKYEGMFRLQRLEMPDIWAPESCAKNLGAHYQADMLCTMEKANADVCSGDSGGGMIGQFEDGQGVRRWFLLGSVSFGKACDDLKSGKEKPSAQVYINATFHRDAIDTFLGTHDHTAFKRGAFKQGGKKEQDQQLVNDEGKQVGEEQQEEENDRDREVVHQRITVPQDANEENDGDREVVGQRTIVNGQTAPEDANGGEGKGEGQEGQQHNGNGQGPPEDGDGHHGGQGGKGNGPPEENNGNGQGHQNNGQGQENGKGGGQGQQGGKGQGEDGDGGEQKEYDYGCDYE